MQLDHVADFLIAQESSEAQVCNTKHNGYGIMLRPTITPLLQLKARMLLRCKRQQRAAVNKQADELYQAA